MNKIQRYKNEQGEECYERKGRSCVECGKPATQLALIIPQDKVMLKKYGSGIIHHWKNREPVCDLRCNAKSSIRNHPLDIERKVKEIIKYIEEAGGWSRHPPKEK